MPLGAWRIDDEHKGLDGRYIEQLVELDPNDLLLPEGDYSDVENPYNNPEGRRDDALRYRDWLETEGTEPPPIEVLETPDGKLKVTDGHRRAGAAKMAGMPVKAWINYNVTNDRGHDAGLTDQMADKWQPKGKATSGPQREAIDAGLRYAEVQARGELDPEKAAFIAGNLWQNREELRKAYPDLEAYRAAVRDRAGETAGREIAAGLADQLHASDMAAAREAEEQAAAQQIQSDPRATGKPWAVPRDEYVESEMDRWGTSATEERDAHKNLIEQAVAAGHDVPPEVLADYPDIAGQSATEAPAEQQGDLSGAILEHLANNPNASLEDIGAAVGVEPGQGADPMASPLNQALVELRDSGRISATQNDFGPPSFSATQEGTEDVPPPTDDVAGVAGNEGVAGTEPPATETEQPEPTREQTDRQIQRSGIARLGDKTAKVTGHPNGGYTFDAITAGDSRPGSAQYDTIQEAQKAAADWLHQGASEASETQPLTHEALPEWVRDEAARNVGLIQDAHQELEKARELDRRHGGEGRYEAETWEKIKGNVESANNWLGQFAESSKMEGFHGTDEYLQSIGHAGNPELSEGGQGWFQDQEDQRAWKEAGGSGYINEENVREAIARGADLSPEWIQRNSPGAATPSHIAADDWLRKNGGDPDWVEPQDLENPRIPGHIRAELEQRLQGQQLADEADAAGPSFDDFDDDFGPPETDAEREARAAQMPPEYESKPHFRSFVDEHMGADASPKEKAEFAGRALQEFNSRRDFVREQNDAYDQLMRHWMPKVEVKRKDTYKVGDDVYKTIDQAQKASEQTGQAIETIEGKKYQGNQKRAAFVRQLRRAEDADSVHRFDEILEMAQRDYPHLLAGYGRGTSSRANPETALFERLQQGLYDEPRLNDPEVGAAILHDMAQREKQAAVPFSRRARARWNRYQAQGGDRLRYAMLLRRGYRGPIRYARQLDLFDTGERTKPKRKRGPNKKKTGGGYDQLKLWDEASADRAADGTFAPKGTGNQTGGKTEKKSSKPKKTEEPAASKAEPEPQEFKTAKEVALAGGSYADWQNPISEAFVAEEIDEDHPAWLSIQPGEGKPTADQFNAARAVNGRHVVDWYTRHAKPGVVTDLSEDLKTATLTHDDGTTSQVLVDSLSDVSLDVQHELEKHGLNFANEASGNDRRKAEYLADKIAQQHHDADGDTHIDEAMKAHGIESVRARMAMRKLVMPKLDELRKAAEPEVSDARAKAQEKRRQTDAAAEAPQPESEPAATPTAPSSSTPEADNLRDQIDGATADMEQLEEEFDQIRGMTAGEYRENHKRNANDNKTRRLANIRGEIERIKERQDRLRQALEDENAAAATRQAAQEDTNPPTEGLTEQQQEDFAAFLLGDENKPAETPEPPSQSTGEPSPLSFAASEKRPTKQHRIESIQAIREVARDIDQKARQLAEDKNYDYNFKGPRPYAISTHYAGQIEGLTRKADGSHYTPTRADLHKAVERARSEMAWQFDKWKKEHEPTNAPTASTPEPPSEPATSEPRTDPNGNEFAPGVRYGLIPRGVANDAHRNTSFVPDKRGEQRQHEFAHALNDVYAKLKRSAGGDEAKMAILNEEWPELVDRARSSTIAALRADSRTASSMITGPANFPERSNQKKVETARQRWEDAENSIEKGHKAILKKMHPERAPQKIGDKSTKTNLQTKLENLEAAQAAMKEANKAIRQVIDKRKSEGGMPGARNPLVFRKNHDLDSAVAHVVEKTGLGEDTVRKMFEHDHGGRLGIPSYALTNNNANIRRVKQQIAAQERYDTKAADVAASGGGTSRDVDFDGGQISLDYDDNRIRIRHDSKPDAETRQKLKSSGWRWSRKHGAWQRQLTPAAEYDAERQTGASIGKPE